MLHKIYAEYLNPPTDMSGITLITMVHPHHGTMTIYLPDEDFHTQLLGIIRGAWINGATIIIQPT